MATIHDPNESGNAPLQAAMSGRLLVVLGAAFLAALLIAQALRSVDVTEVVGTHELDMPLLLKSMEHPHRVVLASDGSAGLLDAAGHTILRGTWSWDEAEGWLRSDQPALDRRMRAFRGWTGVQYRWRLEQKMSHPTEVSMERIGP